MSCSTHGWVILGLIIFCAAVHLFLLFNNLKSKKESLIPVNDQDSGSGSSNFKGGCCS